MQPRCVQTPTMISHSGFWTRSESFCGSRSCEMSTSSAALISSGVRWAIKTGLPRQATVRRWPTWTRARSTSVVDSANVSRAGLSVSMNGQIVAATPTPPIAPAVRNKKSRRVSPGCTWLMFCCAMSAIHKPLARAAVDPARSGAGSYTVDQSELCDRLPQNYVAHRIFYDSVMMLGQHLTRAGGYLRLALFEPDTPQNTGALLRLAACFGVEVDLIEPFGFLLDDRRVKRAGLDYLAHLPVRRHASWRAFLAEHDPRSRLVLMTTTDRWRSTGLSLRPRIRSFSDARARGYPRRCIASPAPGWRSRCAGRP